MRDVESFYGQQVKRRKKVTDKIKFGDIIIKKDGDSVSYLIWGGL